MRLSLAVFDEEVEGFKVQESKGDVRDRTEVYKSELEKIVRIK